MRFWIAHITRQFCGDLAVTSLSRVEVAWHLRGGDGVCGEPGGCWDTEDRSLWWEEMVGAVSKVIDQGTDCDLSRRWSHGSEWLFLTFGQWLLFSTEACPVIICSFLTCSLDRDQLLEMPMKVRPSQVHWFFVSFIYLFNFFKKKYSWFAALSSFLLDSIVVQLCVYIHSFLTFSSLLWCIRGHRMQLYVYTIGSCCVPILCVTAATCHPQPPGESSSALPHWQAQSYPVSRSHLSWYSNSYDSAFGLLIIRQNG